MANSGLDLKYDEDEASRIEADFTEFKRQLNRAQEQYRGGNLEAAAVYASVAADSATFAHCGFFASPGLERLLTVIGKRVVDPKSALPPMPRARSYTRVLHVCTQLVAIGGHTRMLRRWIESDHRRTHSVALTQQCAVPEELNATVVQSGGCIHPPLNMRAGGIFSQVAELRTLALQNDIIVLHVSNSDVIPSIAFADTHHYPPVLYLNHADHMFWLGSSIAHLVLSMRDAAMEISESRRSIEKCRSVLLPILVEPTIRTTQRADAKKRIGLDPECILLLSVARGVKYRTLGGVSYADTHVPILKKYPEAMLITVGPGDQQDWDRASIAVEGRIRSLSARDPKLYFEAADIYVDSYPFCSATSMMEAAGYALPCVTRFPHPPAARICGMDHPGLVGPLIKVRNDADYLKQLSRLIEDKVYREQVGAAIEQSVRQSNVAPGWCNFLEAAFARAAELPAVDSTKMFTEGQGEQCYLGEPDIRLRSIYGFQVQPLSLLKNRLSSLPTLERIARWNDVRREKGFTSKKEAIRCLLPEWLVVRFQRGKSRVTSKYSQKN